MRLKNFLFVLCLFSVVGLFNQCEKYGKQTLLSDDDSDKPAWAGGTVDSNFHIKGNDESGSTRGGDYGDLYKLLRDKDGVPVMWQEPTTLEWYVQPVGADGVELELNAEGELVSPELAIEVDFGRLNIVRSPQGVLDQAFNEAMKVLVDPDDEVISLDFCGRLTSTYTNDLDEVIVKTIDSPRENMAIYQYIMKNMFEPLEDEFGVPTGEPNRLAFLGEPPCNYDPLIIAASCFAAGSDKTGTVDIDEVVYINGFVDCIGLNPILNEHDYDFSHEQNYYFNFSEPKEGDAQFAYSRGVYAERWLKILVLKGDGTYDYDIVNVKKVMEGLWDGMERFNGGVWSGEKYAIEGFTAAVDDAVQVLEFVHGDSNIEFLPDYTP